MTLMQPLRQLALAGVVLWATACGGDGGTGPPAKPTEICLTRPSMRGALST